MTAAGPRVLPMPTVLQPDTRLLLDRLDGASEELAAPDAPSLDRAAALRLPADDRSAPAAVAFPARHEAYHVGQLAPPRELVCLPVMPYAARPEAP